MKLKKTCAILMVISLLLTSYMFPSVQAQTQRGPMSNINIRFYWNTASCYYALKLGDIQLMASPLTYPCYADAITDNNILFAQYLDANEMIGINLNPNQTIKTYGGVHSPLKDISFRKALAYLVDKDCILTGPAFNGQFAQRIDVPLPYSQQDWWNTSLTDSNYPYEFDLNTAETLLDQAGFSDRDYDGTRNYPMGWSGREWGPDLDPIVFYVEDEVRMAAVAGSLRANMEEVGIPVEFHQGPLGWLYTPITAERNYHIYVGSQATWSFPIQFFLMSVMVYALTLNVPGQIGSIPSMMKYTDPFGGSILKRFIEETGLNQALLEAWNAAGFEDAKIRTKDAQSVYMENVFEIPVCSLRSFFAYRRNLLGVVSARGFGINNPYTFLNIRRTDDPSQPIVIGIVCAPIMLNPLYSMYQQDYQCLDKIYTGLLTPDPYNMSAMQPWVAEDWKTGTWYDAEYNKTKTFVDYWFRTDVHWTKPVTGEADGWFTASDYEFTCHYIYDQLPYDRELGFGCPHYDRFHEIYNVTVFDDYHVRVYMNTTSVWADQWPIFPLLPKHKWLREPLACSRSDNFDVGTDIELPSKLPLNEHVVSGSQDTRIKARLANGAEVWLEWGKQFTWKKGDLYVTTNSVNGVQIEQLWVDYWINGDLDRLFGYFPGYGEEGFEWYDILEGCGPFYLKELYVSEGYHIYGANRNFFLETPVLGDIDFKYMWNPGEPPRSGCYKVGLADQVLLANAYGTSGYGSQQLLLPGTKGVWNPAADIATPAGKIGLSDVVALAAHYGEEWGAPP